MLFTSTRGSLGFSLLLVFACETTAPSAPVKRATKPAPAPTEPAQKALTTTEFALADLPPIPKKTLTLVDGPGFTRKPTPKPREVYRGKNLSLPRSRQPLAADRGFVLERESSDPRAKVKRALLLNLDSGEVLAELDTVGTQYPKLGVALARQSDADWETLVLVHARDGHTVPLWKLDPTEDRRVYINAGTGDAWVFYRDLTVELSDDDTTTPVYRYAYWDDLRKPPPEPNLPFLYEFSDSDFRTPEGWLGPTVDNPANAPKFVEVSVLGDKCVKVELRPDGYECVPATTWAMEDGWRAHYDEERDATVFANVSQGVEHVVTPGEGCGVKFVALSPPRALLYCWFNNERLLWSPDEFVKIEVERASWSFPTWSPTANIMFTTTRSSRRGWQANDVWFFNLEDLHLVSGENVRVLSSDSEMKRTVLLASRSRPSSLFVANLYSSTKYAVDANGRHCRDFDSYATVGPISLILCLGRNDEVKEMWATDMAEHSYLKLPTTLDFWIVPQQRKVFTLEGRSVLRERLL